MEQKTAFTVAAVILVRGDSFVDARQRLENLLAQNQGEDAGLLDFWIKVPSSKIEDCGLITPDNWYAGFLKKVPEVAGPGRSLEIAYTGTYPAD